MQTKTAGALVHDWNNLDWNNLDWNNLELLTALHSGIESKKANFAHCEQARDGSSSALPMLIFVYGTLRRGESNHRELGLSRFVSYATTAPRYELVDMGHYPALLEAGHDAVSGELYEVPEHWLGHLDLFEDVPTLYERKPIEVEGAQVLSYVMRREVAGTAPRIASGDWCAVRSGSVAALSGDGM